MVQFKCKPRSNIGQDFPNHFRWRNVVWYRKAKALSEAFVFQTFLHLGGFSATTLYFYSTTATKKSWSFSSIEERSRSICDIILKQNCSCCCTLVSLGVQTIGFLEVFRFYSCNFRCECLFYILIRLWEILSLIIYYYQRYVSTEEVN